MESLWTQQPLPDFVLWLWRGWENRSDDFKLVKEDGKWHNNNLIHSNINNKQSPIGYIALEDSSFEHNFAVQLGLKKDFKYVWSNYSVVIHRYWRTQACENIESKVPVQLWTHATTLCIFWTWEN